MNTRRQSLQSIQKHHCKYPNTSLWLDKFILTQDKNDKDARSKFVNEVSGMDAPENYRMFYARWEKMLDDYKQAGYAVECREAQVRGRMVLGMGNESVLETAVTLHRTYGVPYIPGSALKGLAANFARQYCGSDWSERSENYQTVFGETDKSGCVIFFDAMYKAGSRRALHTDVLTPHHRDYYMKPNISPADWDDPNPVHFLSATGTYLIAIAASEGGREWLLAVLEIVQKALGEMGIGAKTSSGYGRMKFI
jgi:CRISPR-associated protein Cmr6